MSSALPIASYALREGLRRRVLAVTVVLSVAIGALFAVACAIAFDQQSAVLGPAPVFGEPVDTGELTGASLLGFGMFGALFLGAVLVGFLCLGAVRGDAERGLLQPLVVRPIGRTALLSSRFGAAALIAGAYTFAAYSAAVLIVGAIGGYWPSEYLGPGLELVAGVVVLGAIAILGSVFLTATANGIAVFMLFGGGLLAGLLGQIGDALQSDRLERIGEIGAWALPFEALYQDALSAITADPTSATGLVVELGPFGGAEPAGGLLWAWAALYVSVIGTAALLAFRRRDL